MQVSWFADDDYVYLQVLMAAAKDSWFFSFPQDPRQLTQHSCNPVSAGSSCAIAPVTQCNSLPASTAPGEVSAQSIINAPSACTAGAPSTNSSGGVALAYGLQASAAVRQLHAVKAPRPCIWRPPLACIQQTVFMPALQATYYPNAFPDCSSPGSSSLALPSFSSLSADPATPPRCQAALNYQVTASIKLLIVSPALFNCFCMLDDLQPRWSQVYNDTLPSSPALDPSKFSSCYAFQLSGYVYVANNSGLQFLSANTDPKYYQQYR